MRSLKKLKAEFAKLKTRRRRLERVFCHGYAHLKGPVPLWPAKFLLGIGMPSQMTLKRLY
jgi:hypothetical protein